MSCNFEQEEEEAVRLLGDSMGYGRIMQLCEQIWTQKVPGGAHSVGPAVAFLVPCPHPNKDANGICSWCCGSGRITTRVLAAQQAGAMEPGSDLLATNGDHQGQAVVSIAMSAKRIADALEGDKAGGTFFQQMDSWFHHWLGTWTRSGR